MTLNRAPEAYFLTFTTYGTWLHGDDRSSIRRTPQGPVHIGGNVRLHQARRDTLRHEPVLLTEEQRDVCTRTILEVCRYRGWNPYAVNVRTNHVHVVAGAAARPEKVMVDLKAWCTRRLREAGLIDPSLHVWTGQGSTRYLFDPDDVRAACHYVIEEQGIRRGVGEATTWEE